VLQEQYELEEESDIKFQEVKGQEEETQVTQKIITKTKLKLLNRLIIKSPYRNQGIKLKQLKIKTLKTLKINPFILIKAQHDQTVLQQQAHHHLQQEGQGQEIAPPLVIKASQD
jgi:hypothetical protein